MDGHDFLGSFYKASFMFISNKNCYPVNTNLYSTGTSGLSFLSPLMKDGNNVSLLKAFFVRPHFTSKVVSSEYLNNSLEEG